VPTPNTQSSINSIQNLADQRFSQMITTRVLANVLLGVNEQVNCSNCVSAFGSAGSFTAGVHGRYNITDSISILGGLAYAKFNENGFNVTSAPIGAFALRYDFTEWGKSRPFFDIGTVLSPDQRVSYYRSYISSIGPTSVTSNTTASNYSVFERAGWILRLTPRDEIAVSGELWQGWQRVRGYQEITTLANPFSASIADGTDRINLARVGAQWTHLFGSFVEVNVNGGFVQSFASSTGLQAAVVGVGNILPTFGNQHWFELGGRVGARLTKNMTADVFVNGTLGPYPVGNTVHGGIGLRINY
jgi:hypothetical protein